MDEKIEQFKSLVKKSNNIVFFGGAGVSTESGIPDFRSKDGLYNQKYNSIIAIANADMLIVAGTSLTVYPASGLINYFRGKNLVLVNRDSTPYDDRANLVINESLGKVFNEI